MERVEIRIEEIRRSITITVERIGPKRAEWLLIEGPRAIEDRREMRPVKNRRAA